MPPPRFGEIEAAIDPDWMARVLREMILIRSENPFDDPPGEGTREQEMADYLAGHLAALGMTGLRFILFVFSIHSQITLQLSS